MISEERIKTNHMLLTELDMWDEFSVKSINDEWTLRYYNQLMTLLNSQVDEAIKWLDTEEAQEYYFDEASYQYEVFRALEDEWDTILEQKYSSVEALLDEVYRRGKAKGYADMREHIRYTDSDKEALRIVRDYNFHLIRKIDNDTRNHIKDIITSAVLEGENPRKVAPKIKDTVGTRLEGSTFTPKQRAVMIARTEISRVQNTGMLQSYINEGYTEVKILTAEDSNVCYTCLSYAFEFNGDAPVIFENRGEEKVHNIIELVNGEKFPPFHPNCRCTYLSIWKTKVEPPENPYIINLTPSNHNKFADEDSEEGPVVFEGITWTKEKLLSELTGVVSPGDEDAIAKVMLKYIKELKDNPQYEVMTTTDKNFNILSNGHCEEKTSEINIPDEDIETIGKSHFGIVIHNHTSGVPIPSEVDFVNGIIKNRIQYNIIFTPNNGFTVLQNENCKLIRDEESLKTSRRNSIKKINKEINKKVEDYTKELKEKLNDPTDNSVKSDYVLQLKKRGYKDKLDTDFTNKIKILNKNLKRYEIKLTHINS